MKPILVALNSSLCQTYIFDKENDRPVNTLFNVPLMYTSM